MFKTRYPWDLPGACLFGYLAILMAESDSVNFRQSFLWADCELTRFDLPVAALFDLT